MCLNDPTSLLIYINKNKFIDLFHSSFNYTSMALVPIDNKQKGIEST